MIYSTLLTVSFATAVHALNDWSKPCLSGVCSYDIPDSAGSSSGSLKIWGSSNAISDITIAAGWEIIGCSPDKLSQDIRLVCKSEDTKAAGCSHLYDNGGAEGKIVRLPESCGKNAFARIARAWVPEDQSIPDSIVGKIARRAGTPPQVKALALDTNFNAVDSSKTGPVNFAVKGANIKGAAGDIDTSTVGPARRSRIYGNSERGLFDFVGDAIDSIKSLNDFDVDKSKTLDPLTVNKNFNLLNEQLSCPPITASLKIDVDAKANAVVTLGVAASGTIIPPKVKDFAVIASLTGDLDGSVTMVASASGTLDSGKKKIFEIGVPGLDFPGVLTLGPTFEVNAQATAQLDIQADMTVGLNYHVEKAQLIFPPDSKKAQAAGGDAFSVGDTPLKLSLSPSVKATGTVAAHLIPSVNLKISALGDLVEAGVFLELDASVDMNLSLEGTAQASVTVDRAKPKREEPAIKGRYWAIGAPADIEARAAPPNWYEPQAAPSKPAPVKATSSKAAAPEETSVSSTHASISTSSVKATSSKATATAAAHTSVKATSPAAKTTDKVFMASGTVKATSAKPTSVKATSVKATSAATTLLQATSVKATSTKATSAKATSIKATSVKATSTKATSVEATSAKATSIEVTSTKATSVEATSDKATSVKATSIKATSVAATSTEASAAASATPSGTQPPKNTNLSVTKDASASFGGCFKIGAGLDVNAGANADFFGLFNKGTQVSLFSKKFEIFKKCFGNAKRSLPALSKLTRSAVQKRALTCAPSDAGSAVSVADQVVQAGTITAA